MRENGPRSVEATCEACRLEAVVNCDAPPGDGVDETAQAWVKARNRLYQFVRDPDRAERFTLPLPCG